jgi:hypothetical protein
MNETIRRVKAVKIFQMRIYTYRFHFGMRSRPRLNATHGYHLKPFAAALKKGPGRGNSCPPGPQSTDNLLFDKITTPF